MLNKVEEWVTKRFVGSWVVLPLYFVVSASLMRVEYDACVEHFFLFIILVMMIVDMAFDKFLLTAARKSSIIMLRFYIAYGILFALTILLVFFAWMFYAVANEKIDLREARVWEYLTITAAVFYGLILLHIHVLCLIKNYIIHLKEVKASMAIIKNIQAV